MKVAVLFGADAVYIGGEVFGLRAKAKNFTMEEMAEGIRFAHEHGVKVYVTANILAHNDDLAGVEAYFQELKEIGPDALIISDPGRVYHCQREYARRLNATSVPRPTTPIMRPTVSGTSWVPSGWYLPESCLWRRSARSGQIFQMTWRSRPLFMEPCAFLIPEDAFSAIILPDGMPNRGACTHPCRWKYAVMEEIQARRVSSGL